MATQYAQEDILALIVTDHRKVDQLFEEIQKANSPAESKKLFQQIDMELTLHAKAEEKVLYSEMQEHTETKEYVKESKSEHKEAESLLKQLEKLEPSDAEFKSKLQELILGVKHHVEEEEGEVFQAIRQTLNDDELQKLGQEFQAAKDELKPKVEASVK